MDWSAKIDGLICTPGQPSSRRTSRGGGGCDRVARAIRGPAGSRASSRTPVWTRSRSLPIDYTLTAVYYSLPQDSRDAMRFTAGA